nr:hypothetical protein Iba_chr09dCG5930 [Ipomoea batatas]
MFKTMEGRASTEKCSSLSPCVTPLTMMINSSLEQIVQKRLQDGSGA